jgi:hypothetical protein
MKEPHNAGLFPTHTHTSHWIAPTMEYCGTTWLEASGDLMGGRG